MVKTLQEFSGLSGSKTFLKQDDDKVFVRKYFNISRNLERYDALKNSKINIPKIYSVSEDYYDMEYIQNIDMKNYLMREDVNLIIEFLLKTFNTFEKDSTEKDYTEIYELKLSKIQWDELPFSKNQLVKKLPKKLPQTLYHGDLTLDNILYDSKNKRFVLIDPITTEYDSFIFDLAKLNQDLVCGWFVRKDKIFLASKLQKVYDEMSKVYDVVKNKYFLILMLLRILPYCKDDFDKKFILKNIGELWT